jgi:hypothetical protein
VILAAFTDPNAAAPVMRLANRCPPGDGVSLS